MLFLPVVFYGRRGLEADVLASYLRRSGYPVQVVTFENGHLPQVVNKPDSIAVIALDSGDRGLELARRIQRLAGGCSKVFVLNGPDVEQDDPTIEVISRPYNLSEVVKRIQRYSRGN